MEAHSYFELKLFFENEKPLSKAFRYNNKDTTKVRFPKISNKEILQKSPSNLYFMANIYGRISHNIWRKLLLIGL